MKSSERERRRREERHGEQREGLYDMSTTVVTTTVTSIEKKPDLAMCELWLSFVIGVIVAIGSIAPANWIMVCVGIVSAIGSGILIFVQENRQVRVIGFWILLSALVLEAMAFLYLVIVGSILLFNDKFLGLGIVFGTILLVTSIPVLVMAVVDLLTILKLRPSIFSSEKIVITETVSKSSPSETTALSVPPNLPLLAME